MEWRREEKNWNGIGWVSVLLLCVLWVESNGCCGEDNTATHKVVIALEIEIGLRGESSGLWEYISFGEAQWILSNIILQAPSSPKGWGIFSLLSV
jgi:hypothetical protein